jgi:hypothetical protein
MAPASSDLTAADDSQYIAISDDVRYVNYFPV